MKLYHGSNTDIEEIDLSKCRPNKDFGCGFYLTTIKEQAVRMAKRVSRIYGGEAFLNLYEFDESALLRDNLQVKIFERPSIEWAKFIIVNRNSSRMKTISEDNNLDNRYDIVVGPIANDDLALLFRQFSDGVISVETLIEEMKFKELTNQYSFHTGKSIAYLSKAGVEHV